MASIYTMRPDVFVLDEPTTGQDNVTTLVVYRLIENLRAEGATIVCVAHDMILLAEVVERMIVMRDSYVIADTTPRSVFANRELMQSTHLTPPQVSELTLRLTEHHKLDGLSLSVDDALLTLKSRLPTVSPQQ
jgi:energy-coupling factor transport system ATP-binding protein